MITDVFQVRGSIIFHKLFQEKSYECMYMYNYFKVLEPDLFLAYRITKHVYYNLSGLSLICIVNKKIYITLAFREILHTSAFRIIDSPFHTLDPALESGHCFF